MKEIKFMKLAEEVKTKVIGAGSIGNHLAHAARHMGWSVVMTDLDPRALLRTKEEIYPQRYGGWDAEIALYSSNDEPRGGFDAIFIGTPPDSHLSIATRILREEPPAVLQIEKPLCAPTLDGVNEFLDEVAKNPRTMVVVGYNYVLHENTLKIKELAVSHDFGQLLTMDVNLRARWDGILRAHPWLSGPQDTYLGFRPRGGGASGEHSHGLNLWQHFAQELGYGRVERVQAAFDNVKNGAVDYDRSCFLTLVTTTGLMGRVVQDVVTFPEENNALFQFEYGRLEWRAGVEPGVDQVRLIDNRKRETHDFRFMRTGADGYLREMAHIDGLLKNAIPYQDSPLRLGRGLDTMCVLNAADSSANAKGEFVDVLSFL